MNVLPQAADVLRFRTLISRDLGLLFEDDKLDYLADVLRERLEAVGRDRSDAYLQRLGAGAPEEIRVLAARLTIGETYFFRYADHFRAFVDVVLPDRAKYEEGQRRLRILSAGCSSGAEAYSLAILVRDHLPNAGSWDVRIHGIDVNPQMVEQALAARYSTWALRATPADVRDRNFRAQGRDFQLVDDVRSAVTFEERNLLDDDPQFWRADAFDVVFCRNVTMYFTPEIMRSVVARIAGSLVPGGFLFLGHAETLRGISSDFHLCHTHNTFYYQRRDADRLVASTSEGQATPPADLAPTLARPSVALGLDDSSWISAIQGASDRIALLSTGPRPLESTARAAGATHPEWDLRAVVEVLQEERFADAMALLQALPPASQIDVDAQLLRAVLFTNRGQLSEAEAVCQQILSKDELHAGAHYLVALCREHAADIDVAREHDQVATYLDPGFAMPHLHLGLLARRSGDLVLARTELERALTLLACEDAMRILLFGGGFRRETLIELCRAELRTCGGTS